MKIYNEEKTQELNEQDLDFTLGYLKSDKRLVAHHDAVEEKKAIYADRIVEEENGGISVYKDLVSPAAEAKEEWDEYEDVQVYVPYTAEEIEERKLARLRAQRETECFPIINRGQLWYDGLTEQQIAELTAWYKDWLNVTQTLVVPKKPEWLK